MITIRRAPSRSRAAATIESGSGATRPGISTAGVSPVNARPDDIGRHLDVGRSRPARHRAAQRLGDRRRDRLGGARPADVRGDRLERPALVGRLVQDAAAEAVERRVDLAGQQHDRRRVRPRLGERGERVERSRAGGRRQDARDDPAPGRSRRRRTRPPARDGSGCAGWRLAGQRVVEGQRVEPGDAEHGVDPGGLAGPRRSHRRPDVSSRWPPSPADPGMRRCESRLGLSTILPERRACRPATLSPMRIQIARRPRRSMAWPTPPATTSTCPSTATGSRAIEPHDPARADRDAG